MFVSQFLTICASNVIFIICANIEAASIVLHRRKLTDTADVAVEKVISAERESFERPQHKRPHFKVVEQATMKRFASIKNPKQSFAVYRSIVQGDTDDDSESDVHDDSETYWNEYGDDGDDYDGKGNKYESAAEQNGLADGKDPQELKSNQKKQKDHTMEKLHSDHWNVHGRSGVMVGSPKVESMPLPKIDSPQYAIPPEIYSPFPALYPTYTYSMDACGNVVLLSCQPDLSQFGCARAYDYRYYNQWSTIYNCDCDEYYLNY